MLSYLVLTIFLALTTAVPHNEIESALRSLQNAASSPVRRSDKVGRQACYGSCASYQTCCAYLCCNSGYYCSTSYECLIDSSSGGSSGDTCSSYQTACGTAGLCCDSTSETCTTDSFGSPTCASQDTTSSSNKNKKPKSSSSSKNKSKKIPGKVIAGAVIGALAGLAIIVGFVLFLFYGFIKKKKTNVAGPGVGGETKETAGVMQ